VLFSAEIRSGIVTVLAIFRASVTLNLVSLHVDQMSHFISKKAHRNSVTSNNRPKGKFLCDNINYFITSKDILPLLWPLVNIKPLGFQSFFFNFFCFISLLTLLKKNFMV
jgi:hypothetical protein